MEIHGNIRWSVGKISEPDQNFTMTTTYLIQLDSVHFRSCNYGNHIRGLLIDIYSTLGHFLWIFENLP